MGSATTVVTGPGIEESIDGALVLGKPTPIECELLHGQLATAA